MAVPLDSVQSVLFGGFGMGGHGTGNARLGDVVVVSGADVTGVRDGGGCGSVRSMSQSCTGVAPAPRVRHAAARMTVWHPAKGRMVPLMAVSGGRSGPKRPFGDVQFLDLDAWQWRPSTIAETEAGGDVEAKAEAVGGGGGKSGKGDGGVSGCSPSPRWSHTLTSLSSSSWGGLGEAGSHALLYGGRDAVSVFDDAWVLTVEFAQNSDSGVVGVGGACDDGARKAVVRPWSNVLAVEHRRHADAGHRKQPDFPASPLHAQYLCVPPESCPRWLPPLKAC